jgi:hypothetical protein
MLQTAVRLLWLSKVHRHDHKSRYLTNSMLAHITRSASEAIAAVWRHMAMFRNGPLPPSALMMEQVHRHQLPHPKLSSSPSSQSLSSCSLFPFHLKHYFVLLEAPLITSRHLTLDSYAVSIFATWFNIQKPNTMHTECDYGLLYDGRITRQSFP